MHRARFKPQKADAAMLQCQAWNHRIREGGGAGLFVPLRIKFSQSPRRWEDAWTICSTLTLVSIRQGVSRYVFHPTGAEIVGLL